MIPLVGVPKSIEKSLEKYKGLFKRKKGFETVSRFITGLILSPNKTLEGIHSQQFWEDGKGIKRRAMHHAVFEAGWKSEEIMPQHRDIIAPEHRGCRNDEPTPQQRPGTCSFPCIPASLATRRHVLTVATQATTKCLPHGCSGPLIGV